MVSGLQKGPAERGHVKKTSKIVKKVSKSFSTLLDNFSRRAKNVKKASKSFSTFFDHFRAAPFFRPFWGALEMGFGIIIKQESLHDERPATT